MATGINKGEKLSEDSAIAPSSVEDKFPLLPELEVLSQRARMPVNQILSFPEIAFSAIQNSKFHCSKLSQNALVFADNFNGLRALNHLAGKVRLIYLDPPYNTGMDFQGRDLQHAYNDMLSEAAYLEFMRRRFVLMRELLASDGSIYVHLGHQMVFHVKVLLDEIFGPSNFRNVIIRKKCSSKNSTHRQFPNLNDYILFYSKSSNYYFEQPKVSANPEWIKREYPYQDELSGRFYKLVPIHAPGTRNGATGQPWKGMTPPPGKHWQLTPDKLTTLDKRGDIHWSKNGNPRRKVWLEENKQLPRTDYWEDFRDAHHQSVKITGYPTEKNLKMIETIVAASSEGGDTVLDPFCGSGTTLEAADNLGRKWIGIDQSLAAIEASFTRLVHGTKAMGDFVIRETKQSEFSFNPSSASKSTEQKSYFKLYADIHSYKRYEKSLKRLVGL